jgi:GTPase SAR1 family protein
MSKELDYIEEGLNVAANKGAFTLKESAQIQHCVDVTRSKLNDLDKVKEESKKLQEELKKLQEEPLKEEPGNKPGPSLTKDDKPISDKDPIKQINHK